MSQTIGILGGMGPAATVSLFQNIIESTIVKVDQDHIPIVIINDPKIPDRTKFITGTGESPIPNMIKNLQKLKGIGASVAMIPCMTAHTFIDELQESIDIPIVNGIELAQLKIERLLNANRIGLLATEGSIKSKVYNHYINREIITPDDLTQLELMNLIYGKNGIKAGNTTEPIISKLSDIVKKLQEKNIQALIAGCTELSLVMDKIDITIPIIDPLYLLAEKAVEIGQRNHE